MRAFRAIALPVITTMTPGSAVARALELYDRRGTAKWRVTSLKVGNGSHVLLDGTGTEYRAPLQRTANQQGRVLVLTQQQQQQQQQQQPT